MLKKDGGPGCVTSEPGSGDGGPSFSSLRSSSCTGTRMIIEMEIYTLELNVY
jgi:hypothetical protein